MSARRRLGPVEAHLAVVTKLGADLERAIVGIDAITKSLEAADRSPAGTRGRSTLARVRRSLDAARTDAVTTRVSLERARDVALRDGGPS